MNRRIVIGDVHGCYRTFRKMVEEQIRLEPADNLYLLGDYIDRGPSSREVLDYIIHLQGSGYMLFPIRGNHEKMMLEAGMSKWNLSLWIQNGAETTLKSFGIDWSLLAQPGILERIPRKYRDFMGSLPYYHELEDYYIVHAGFSFASEEPFRDKDAMVWSREGEYDAEKAGGRKIIHGHTPVSVEEIQKTLRDPSSKLINLDAGCVYTIYDDLGNLAAWDIDEGRLYILPNMESK